MMFAGTMRRGISLGRKVGRLSCMSWATNVIENLMNLTRMEPLVQQMAAGPIRPVAVGLDQIARRLGAPTVSWRAGKP